jgi:hypothetical protein
MGREKLNAEAQGREEMQFHKAATVGHGPTLRVQ